MKMTKKLLSVVLAVVMALSLTIPAMATNVTDLSNMEFHSTNPGLQRALEQIDPQYIEDYSKLSFEEKENKLKELAHTYGTGDVLNEADSAFVLLNRYEEENMPKTRVGSGEKWYDVYKTQYGVEVNLYGNMRQTIVAVAGTNTFGGTATLWVKSGAVQRVDLEINHIAYGLMGTSAPFVGVLYNGSVTMSKSGNNQTTKMDKEKSYGAVVCLYTTMNASATVCTSSGDEFIVTSELWKIVQ